MAEQESIIRQHKWYLGVLPGSEEDAQRGKKMLSKIVVHMARLMYLIAGLAMASSVLLTVSDVILRIFRRPILGTYELVGVLAAVAIGFSLPQTSRTGGHVFLDMLTDRLPPDLWKGFHILTRTLAILFFAAVGWYLCVMGNDFVATGESSTTLQIPLYPVAYTVAFCCFAVCLEFLAEMSETKEGKQ